MILVGVIIMAWGLIGVSKLIALIPHSCMIGFVNGLAVIISTAQLGAFEELNKKHDSKDGEYYGELAWMICITIITFIIVEFLPRFAEIFYTFPHRVLCSQYVEYFGSPS